MKLKIQTPLKRALDRECRHWENTVIYTIIILTQISSYFFVKGEKKKKKHYISLCLLIKLAHLVYLKMQSPRKVRSI